MYYSNELNNCKSDLRKTWGTLREAMRNTKDKSSSIDELRYNNEIFVKKPDIFSKMNEHFTSVADKIASKMHSINSNIIIGIVSKMEGKRVIPCEITHSKNESLSIVFILSVETQG